MGMLARRKRKQWAENTRNEILAYKHLAVHCLVTFGERLSFGENPTNYAHKVWLKNRGAIDDSETVLFQRTILHQIEREKKAPSYTELSRGEASPELVVDTLMRYDYSKKHGC